MREHCQQLYRATTGIGLRLLHRKEAFPKGDLGRLLAMMGEIEHNGLSSCGVRCASPRGRGRASAQQNGYWKLQYPRAVSDISASKPPPIGGFANQAQVGFFFTNGVGGVNGAARIGATLPRGRICG